LVKTIQALMVCSHLEPDIQGTAHHEIHSQYLSAEKARSLLGWRPRYTQEEGLKETIDWYSSFIGARG
jgi:CDP-glucose 4,6-dehydratase